MLLGPGVKVAISTNDNSENKLVDMKESPF
jgi:hypothetical protein